MNFSDADIQPPVESAHGSDPFGRLWSEFWFGDLKRTKSMLYLLDANHKWHQYLVRLADTHKLPYRSRACSRRCSR